MIGLETGPSTVVLQSYKVNVLLTVNQDFFLEPFKFESWEDCIINKMNR